MGYGEWCPLSSRLGDLGERRELSQRGPGRAENGFWRILKATEVTEGSFCIYMTKNLRGTICTSVLLLQILEGTCPPRDLRPWLPEIAMKIYYVKREVWSLERIRRPF